MSPIGSGDSEGNLTQQQPSEQENVDQKRLEQMTKSQEDGSPLDVGFEKQNYEEIKENPEKGAEIREAAEQTEKLDDATLDPEAKIESEGDYKQSETLQEVFTAAVDAVPTKEDISATPDIVPDISQEESRDGATIASDLDDDSKTEIGQALIEKAQDPEGGKVTIDRAEVAEAAGDQGDVKIDTVPLPEKPAAADQGSVKIDTVPLPEKPDEAGEVSSSREADSREAIGTWPTPEVPVEEVERVDPAAIIDSIDSPSTVGRFESSNPSQSNGGEETSGEPTNSEMGDPADLSMGRNIEDDSKEFAADAVKTAEEKADMAVRAEAVADNAASNAIEAQEALLAGYLEELNQLESQIIESLVIKLEACNPQESNEFKELAKNYLSTLLSIDVQIAKLEQMQTQSESGLIVLLYAEKQSDGTYSMVSKPEFVSEDTIPTIIQNMETIRDQIVAELSNLESQLP